MSSFSHWFDTLGARQDYVWFLAALAWLAVAGLAFRLPSSGEAGRLKVWLVVSAAGGFGSGLIQLVLGVSAGSGPMHPRNAWEGALIVCECLQLIAVMWAITPSEPRWQRPWRAIWIGLIVASGAWRIAAPFAARELYQGMTFERGSAPLVSSWLFATVHVAAIAAAIRLFLRPDRSPGDRRIRRGLLMVLAQTALAGFLGSTGVLAETLKAAPRWPTAEFSTVGALAAGLELCTAGMLAWTWWRWLGWPAVRESTGWRTERVWLFWSATVWLLLGFILAEWAGYGARRRFEDTLLAQARMASLLLPPELMEKCLGPELRLGRSLVRRQNSGRATTVFETPHAETPEFHLVRSRLSLIASRGKLQFASVVTLRDGWLISAISPIPPGAPTNLVGALRRATSGDLASWSDPGAEIDGPTEAPGGIAVNARAPLFGSDRRMLGWLNLRISAIEWGASQAQARLLTFTVVAFGLVLALLVVIQRWNALRHEAARRKAADAMAADRAKSDFLAKVSHELRTPAQSIIGYADVLASSKLDERQTQWLASLRAQTELMVRVVSDLLDLSALQMGTFRVVEREVAFVPLLQDAINALRIRAEQKRLALTLTIDAGLPTQVWCDAARVRQVLQNLVANAVKFTTEGYVHVHARRMTELPDAPDCVWCEINVSDTGPGIPLDGRDRLFRPFSRLPNAVDTEGAGLGLSLAAALLQSMGGAISVESDGLTGTTFRTRWLLRLSTGATVEAATASDGLLSGHHILVAEDNLVIRELLTTYMTACGASVEAVADGEAAAARAVTGDFDVLLLDLSLPHRDGIEVARHVRSKGFGPDRLRVIGLSAHASGQTREHCLAAGMDAFFLKPADIRVVAAAIKGQEAQPDHEMAIPLKLARRLRQQFSDEYPGQLDQLRAAARSADWNRALTIAHQLKGAAGMLQEHEIHATCERLETAARQKNKVAAIAAWERLEMLSPDRMASAEISARHQH